MKQTIYTANSSIVLPQGKKYKDAFKLNLQWLWESDVGTKKWNRLMFRVSKRARDYDRSIHVNDPDYEWPVHAQVLERHMQLRRNKGFDVYSGKGKLYGQNNKRMDFTSCLLVYDKELDIFNAEFYIGNVINGFKLSLKPQNKELYPYRGNYTTTEEIVGKGTEPNPWM